MNHWKELGGAVLLSSSVVLTGCATAGASTGNLGGSSVAVDPAEVETQSRIRALESDLQSRDLRIEELQKSLQSMESTPKDMRLFPPDAKAGQCYARVLTPEKYRTVEERVLVQEASEAVSVIPARFETAKERVLVKEASTRIETIPAEYEMVTERVVVTPASKKIVEVPATFRTVTEQVLDKPAYTVWKRGPASSFADPVLSESVSATGEVMCLVEVPASYRTITRKVLDVPAHTKEVEVPAEYKTITKRVLKRPATTREVTIPAEYQTVSVQKLLEPAKEVRRKVPAQYRTVARTEKVADAALAWQQVLCKVNATPDNVTSLQRALNAKGFSPGPIDGVLGPQTLSAVSRYAKQQGIPYGANYVPMEVLKALRLKI